MGRFFKFFLDMLTNRCECGAAATSHPHGIPCCDACVHEVDCSVWLGYDCDCGKG